MSDILNALTEALSTDGRVTEAETLAVRRAIFADGAVSRAEAEMLFDLNERCEGDDPAWNACFVEAICDHLLLGAAPEGHVTDADARWLLDRIERDGQLEGPTELELLARLCEKAESCPPVLIRLARHSVQRAIIDGHGYHGRDPSTAPGAIGPAEVTLIRRALYAGDAFVSREEAEWLFELDEATHGAPSDAGWPQLFVAAILNHLRAPAPSALLDRNAMIGRAERLTQPTGGVLGVFARMLSSGSDSYWSAIRQRDVQKEHLAAREQAAIDADKIEASETGWLFERIARDGRRTPNEAALLEAIRAEAGRAELAGA